MDEVAVMENLRYMADTDGWKLVEKFINNRITYHKSQLMICPLDDVQKHRHKVEALRSVLKYVQDAIDEGLEVLQQQPP